MRARKSYQGLLGQADVRRWYENVARGSEATADVYLRRLGSFCESNRLKPRGLAALKQRKLEDLVLDFVGSEEKRGVAGSYIASSLKAIRSWLAHNRRKLEIRIRIKGPQEAPTLKEERIPSKHELTRILFAGDKKTRVASILLAHAGLRIETLGDYSGSDGLRVGDFPELRIEKGRIEFTRVPTAVVVRPELSKGGHRYFSFLGPEGCSYLKDYLEERIRTEKLTSDSSVIRPKVAPKPFVRATNVGDSIRKAIRKAGFGWRPYVLRSYFDSQMLMAENAGKIARDYRVFFMGHVGDIEARYTTHKGKLPQSMIEDMRLAYERCQDYLQTTPPESPLKEETRRQLLLVAGFEERELARMNLRDMTDDEFKRMVRCKLAEMLESNPKQKIVPIEELENSLAHGWEFVAALPNEKAIVKGQ